jgi:hypothetical protein
MFDFKRLVRFFGEILKFLIPFLFSAWILALITEFFTREGDWSERLFSRNLWIAAMLDMIPSIATMMS